MAAIIPCKNFPKIYFFIDMSDFDIILRTCSNIDKPPKPSKKAHIIILIEIDLLAILEIIEIPLVSSIIPEIIGDEKQVLIFKNFRIGYRP